MVEVEYLDTTCFGDIISSKVIKSIKKENYYEEMYNLLLEKLNSSLMELTDEEYNYITNELEYMDNNGVSHD